LNSPKIGHHGVPSHHSKQARPGYVTLPRRPRASWSAPPPPQGTFTRDSPSPCLSQFSGRTEFREPIYDGVGPRTSADGSSKANLNTNTLPRNQHLNKSFDTHSYGVRTPLSSGNGYTLPPYYAPIEEVQVNLFSTDKIFYKVRSLCSQFLCKGVSANTKRETTIYPKYSWLIRSTSKPSKLGMRIHEQRFVCSNFK